MSDDIDFSLQGRIRGTAPPKSPGLQVEVIRITGTEFRTFYLLSNQPWCAYFHWVGHSVRCLQTEECDRCRRNTPKKWRAYIHALEHDGTITREVILEVTQLCIASLLALNGESKLRGTIVKLKKSKGGAKGRYLVDVLPRRVSSETLPTERDPEPILQRLWAYNEKRPDKA